MFGFHSCFLVFCRDDSTPFVTWIDNYNHTHHCSAIRISKPDYKLNNWTVEARFLVVNPDHNVDLSINYSPSGPISIMPTSISPAHLTSEVIASISTEVISFEQKHKLSARYAFHATLPKVDFSKINDTAKKRAKDNSRFMPRFVPTKLHSVHIGSNVGLAKIASILRNRFLEPPHHRTYQIILCDVNIYERSLKVPVLCVLCSFFRVSWLDLLSYQASSTYTTSTSLCPLSPPARLVLFCCCSYSTTCPIPHLRFVPELPSSLVYGTL